MPSAAPARCRSVPRSDGGRHRPRDARAPRRDRALRRPPARPRLSGGVRPHRRGRQRRDEPAPGARGGLRRAQDGPEARQELGGKPEGGLTGRFRQSVERGAPAVRSVPLFLGSSGAESRAATFTTSHSRNQNHDPTAIRPTRKGRHTSKRPTARAQTHH